MTKNAVTAKSNHNTRDNRFLFAFFTDSLSVMSDTNLKYQDAIKIRMVPKDDNCLQSGKLAHPRLSGRANHPAQQIDDNNDYRQISNIPVGYFSTAAHKI